MSASATDTDEDLQEIQLASVSDEEVDEEPQPSGLRRWTRGTGALNASVEGGRV
jgi:hypothetical protein